MDLFNGGGAAGARGARDGGGLSGTKAHTAVRSGSAASSVRPRTSISHRVIIIVDFFH